MNCIVCGKEDIGAHGCVSCAIKLREELFSAEIERLRKALELIRKNTKEYYTVVVAALALRGEVK